jgi:hypothetical protein
MWVPAWENWLSELFFFLFECVVDQAEQNLTDMFSETGFQFYSGDIDVYVHFSQFALDTHAHCVWVIIGRYVLASNVVLGE